MKKFLIILVGFFGLLNLAQAGNGSTIQTIIRQKLSIPAPLKTQKLNEKVLVEFRINDDGKAHVLSVKTENSELKKAIIENFKTMDFSKSEVNKGSSYFIDINFKVL